MKLTRWAAIAVLPALIAGCATNVGGRSIPATATTVSSDLPAPRSMEEYNSLAALVGAKAALRVLTRRYSVMSTAKNASHVRATASSGRAIRTVYMITSCTTTYLNVSGTYDTSTDPIIAQSCSTSYVEDDMGPPADLTDPCAAADDPVACYAATDKHPKYKSQAERDCEASKGRFVTVNPGKTSDGGTRTDVGTTCVPWQNLLTPAAPTEFHQPGGCSGLDIWVAGIGIIIDAPNTPEQRSTTQVGVRVNADCSTTWVPPSS